MSEKVEVLRDGRILEIEEFRLVESHQTSSLSLRSDVVDREREFPERESSQEFPRRARGESRHD